MASLAQPMGHLCDEELDHRYRLVRPLGRGGTACVFAAEQLALGRLVAIKMLDLSSCDENTRLRFEREARLTCLLTHSHTVRAFDFGYDRRLHVAYLVMPLFQGETLAEHLRRHGPMPPMLVAHLIEQIAGSLDEAHSKGLVHRDLKPENIMLISQDGRDNFVKVIDFGIAKNYGDASKPLTDQGAILGTPYYMAPEQIQRTELTPAIDVYALGAITFELLTGQRPFYNTNPYVVLHSHLTQPRPRVSTLAPSLPSTLDRVIQKAMAIDPTHRHSSAWAFAQALQHAWQHAAGSTLAFSTHDMVATGRFAVTSDATTTPSPNTFDPMHEIPITVEFSSMSHLLRVQSVGMLALCSLIFFLLGAFAF